MKILVLNGSPNGKKSSTMKLTNSFLTGIKKTSKHVETTTIDINQFDIKHCLGCFACWTKTPGKCVIKDDMELLLNKYLEADIIIWSFPLYYYSMPSKIKAFMDRMLPLNLPYINNTSENSGSHPSRYDMSRKKYVLISTCGFHSLNNNYEALLKQFKILYGDKLTKILCSEGELFKVGELSKRTNEYLDYVSAAGEEFIKDGQISDETELKLAEQLYPTEQFIEMANNSWKIKELESNKKENNESERALLLLKLMASIYNSSKLKNEGTVIEFKFIDINKRYQLKLYKDRCNVQSENLDKYTMQIETTFDLWKKISNGEVDGAQALMEKRYKVNGDFSLMMDFNSFFNAKEESLKIKEKSSENKKANMFFLFLPWIPFWSMKGIYSASIAIIIVTLINLFSEKLKYKMTIYDKINMAIASSLGLLSLINSEMAVTTFLIYIIFFITWGGSCLTKIPLTAYYSINDYDESLFSNPLFLKTNRILTFLWSLVYLIVGGIAYYAEYIGIYFAYLLLFKLILFISMLSFTKWFADWYPAKAARGSGKST